MSLFALSDQEALAVAASRSLPCFVYRLDHARERYGRLRAALPSRVNLAYAVKANPGRPLVSAFAKAGSWFDCASIGELKLVKELGVPGSRLLFAGPGKTAEELALALDLGARIECDGVEDLERIDSLLARQIQVSALHDRKLAISLRIHPASGVSESSKIIGGSGPSAFGVDEENLEAFVAEAARFSRLSLQGLQVFAASNEKSAEKLLANYRVALEIARKLQEAGGRQLDLIDLGGGLGIPYKEEEGELDIVALGRGIEALLAEHGWFKGSLVVEPGRWLAGPEGVYLSRVIRTKQSRGTSFAIMEGGVNHLLRPLLTGSPFPARAPGIEGKAGPTTLAGPLCTSLDRLGDVVLPPLKAGDVVMLGQAGAYGFTESMAPFLSHPVPAEHWYETSPLA